MNQISEYRTSSQVHFQRGEFPLIADIEQRIANITQTPIENGEGIQFAYYRQNEYYRQHYDYFDTYFDGNRSQLMRGGQRILTFMVYLNTLEREDGGGTYFPRFDLRIRPETGKALMWWNVCKDDYSKQDDGTIHSAEPVITDKHKAIFTKWIRERKFV